MTKLKKSLLAAFASATFASHAFGQKNDADLVALDPAADITIYTEISTPQNQPVQNECIVPENMKGGLLMVERSCVTLSDFLKNPSAYEAEASYPPLMALFNSASFGREMLEFVAESDPDLRLCDMELSEVLAAVYNGEMIGVDYNRHSNLAVHVVSIVHEMAHHYQFENKVRPFDMRRSLIANQLVLLAIETAAPVVSWIALFQAAEDGTLDWRTSLPSKHPDYKMMEMFTARYQDLTASGAAPDQALNDTATYMWQQAFKDQNRLDFYNSFVVRNVMTMADYLEPGFFNYRDASPLWAVMQAGKMGEAIDFSSPEDFPAYNALFGNNQDMREIYEAVEWYRNSRMLGADHEVVKLYKDYLVENGNRFTDVDFEDITCKILQGMDSEAAFKSAIEPAETVDLSLLNPAAAFKDTAVKNALQNWTAETVTYAPAHRKSPALAA